MSQSDIDMVVEKLSESPDDIVMERTYRDGSTPFPFTREEASRLSTEFLKSNVFNAGETYQTKVLKKFKDVYGIYHYPK